MSARPTLRPMSEFDPSEPAVLHDMRSDTMIAWTAEREREFRTDAAWYDDRLVLWDGALLDGWVEALGG